MNRKGTASIKGTTTEGGHTTFDLGSWFKAKWDKGISPRAIKAFIIAGAGAILVSIILPGSAWFMSWGVYNGVSYDINQVHDLAATYGTPGDDAAGLAAVHTANLWYTLFTLVMWAGVISLIIGATFILRRVQLSHGKPDDSK